MRETLPSSKYRARLPLRCLQLGEGRQMRMRTCILEISIISITAMAMAQVIAAATAIAMDHPHHCQVLLLSISILAHSRLSQCPSSNYTISNSISNLQGSDSSSSSSSRICSTIITTSNSHTTTLPRHCPLRLSLCLPIPLQLQPLLEDQDHPTAAQPLIRLSHLPD